LGPAIIRHVEEVTGQRLPALPAGTGATPSLIPNHTAAAVNLTNHPKPSTQPNPLRAFDAVAGGGASDPSPTAASRGGPTPFLQPQRCVVRTVGV